MRADGRLGAAGFTNADRGLAELRLEVGDDLVGLIQIALQSLNLFIQFLLRSGGVRELFLEGGFVGLKLLVQLLGGLLGLGDGVGQGAAGGFDFYICGVGLTIGGLAGGLLHLEGAVEFVDLFGQFFDFIILKTEPGDVIGVLYFQAVNVVAEAGDFGLKGREVGTEVGDELVGIVGAASVVF